MMEFVRWETPFTEKEFPSVVVMTTRGDEGQYLIEAVVAPDGIDEYPKYLVEFGVVVGFSSMEEMFFPDHGFANARNTEDRLSSYRILNSPWVESYNRGENFIFNEHGREDERLSHYIIFGGDDFLKVVTKNEPKVTMISEPNVRMIAFPY